VAGTAADAADPGHRVVEEWMGTEVETLRDLVRPGLRTICVGINPSPVSVAAGHDYQGTLGRQFFTRLRVAGVLAGDDERHEDDRLFAQGVGFTDLVKRPTARAAELDAGELAHGRTRLAETIVRSGSPLVIFTFLTTARLIVGREARAGLLRGAGPGQADCFVMPGPYARADIVSARLGELAEVWRQTRLTGRGGLWIARGLLPNPQKMHIRLVRSTVRPPARSPKEES
jgi:TDG/mug DNA glycosylase family protein